MTAFQKIFVPSLLFLFIICFTAFGNPADSVAKKDESGVKWLTIEEALAKNKANPKKIFIDLYTSWCGWCKVMDSQTFSDPIIAEYINKTYYPVKFNAEIKDTILFKGKKYSFISNGSRGHNELAPELTGGRMSFPTIIFLDETANTIQSIPGFRRPAELDLMLKYFGENYYRHTDYETFQNSYISPFSQEEN